MQGPSLSDRQRGTAANDHSNTPSPQLYEATAVSHTGEMQKVPNGGWEGEQMWGLGFNKESMHVYGLRK